MRGEKFFSGIVDSVLGGSPPHARGKEFPMQMSQAVNRITPACAGKSRPVMDGVHSVKDHPRMRGEKSKSLHRFTRGIGSPPHARGKGGFCPCDGPETGITPACAGKR